MVLPPAMREDHVVPVLLKAFPPPLDVEPLLEAVVCDDVSGSEVSEEVLPGPEVLSV